MKEHYTQEYQRGYADGRHSQGARIERLSTELAAATAQSDARPLGYVCGQHMQPSSKCPVCERDALMVRVRELEDERDAAREEVIAFRGALHDHQLMAKEHDTASKRLSDLLARIHRDGGHYEAEHGTEKACADADEKVVTLMVRVEELELAADGVGDTATIAYDAAQEDIKKLEARVRELESLRCADGKCGMCRECHKVVLAERDLLATEVRRLVAHWVESGTIGICPAAVRELLERIGK